MNCIIVEDEIPAQRIIRNYCSRIDDLHIAGVFNSALKANSFLNSNDVDLIFLDINLPDITGMDFLKSLSKPPLVIMTTAYPNYAAESFELDTIIDYLVKPFSLNRFLKAINKVNDLKQQSATVPEDPEAASFFLSIDKTHHRIYFNDIKYVMSERNYCSLVTTKTRYTYIESLKKLEAELPSYPFIRIHKSYIVNSRYIDKISGNMIYIEENKIPIGRTYRAALFKLLELS
ncbi:response regulator [Leptobacterium flavescens]|uniref:Response regulator n=1 Tax=Leptobacterium flavescens TaxID=472055 RepID=A0A6P0UJL8_9FLAO|nr:LytTR family DNA-binding domain-containing protein [Leptobacterium flavescens]NER13177.1 response regulator [Leptobacterium flavescens]